MNLRSAHPFFSSIEIKALDPDTFDSQISEPRDQVVAVFFWGPDCPNCESAKNALLATQNDLRELGFRWFDVNVYDHFDLGSRFGLHGIPTFLFFKNGKKLGRISPFPGPEPFYEALRKLSQT